MHKLTSIAYLNFKAIHSIFKQVETQKNRYKQLDNQTEKKYKYSEHLLCIYYL